MVDELLSRHRAACEEQTQDPQVAPPTEPSDRELVVRTKKGEPEAFDCLIQRYQRRLFNVIYGIVLNYQDADDVLLETLVKAYRNINRFREDSSFYTWIYRIAVNSAINWRRRAYTRPTVSLEADEEERPLPEELVDQRSGRESLRRLELEELQKKLNECLSRLSYAHRVVVTLFDLEGMSHGEIAQILGCSEGTVRSRLFYAHQQLKRCLQGYW
ncbi:RNA polymerase sigma factor [Candidatus Methylacidithermus pantelleriae]|uniref:DNA-directed RNA polymerase specialized sigma subunit n=1 Tax=Candidatus Methylacidithermus pantelleriae TaxID=2744239 RepID=A0A8J2BL87_9BACT|nr:sigma-70 family RNA polymerase sigma factor [Candidatus Methylacidithermus pantelleriae]CAF0692445.1 DNA-directed RNA polymerase specialized sigma subunit [Candidatus Methylacidithermus pantelleriae]